jgi:hypothetical protein
VTISTEPPSTAFAAAGPSGDNPHRPTKTFGVAVVCRLRLIGHNFPRSDFHARSDACQRRIRPRLGIQQREVMTGGLEELSATPLAQSIFALLISLNLRD